MELVTKTVHETMNDEEVMTGKKGTEREPPS
jgi:hypothetical protein